MNQGSRESRIPRVRSEMAERLIKELEMALPEVARLLGGFTLATSKSLHKTPKGSDKPMQMFHRNLPTIFSSFCEGVLFLVEI